MGLRSEQNAQGSSGLVAVARREKGTCTVACMWRRRYEGVNKLQCLHRLPRIFQEFIVAFGLKDTAPPAKDGPYLHPGLVLMQRSVALGVEALAQLLACGEDDLRVSINFGTCIDCNEVFKSSSSKELVSAWPSAGATLVRSRSKRARCSCTPRKRHLHGCLHAAKTT